MASLEEDELLMLEAKLDSIRQRMALLEQMIERIEAILRSQQLINISSL